MEFYFTSDSHYNHKNIVRGVSGWDNKDRCRDFDTLEEHNQVLVDNINKTVGENDILYHAGDWSFGGIQSIYEFRQQIKCKTIHFIIGNHDHHIKMNRVLKIEEGFMNTKNLFTTVDKLLDKTVNGQNMVMCHYPLRSWLNGSKGSWMLFGHTHGSLPEYSAVKGYPKKNAEIFKTMDVGIDTHKEFRPYHFDEIAEIMHNRSDLNVDHH